MSARPAQAEVNMMKKMENKEYLSMDGLPAFRAATLDLLLGAGHPAIKEGRAVAVQSLSGTSSVKVVTE
jgi:aspartate/tyrosine/aromatic aminotransferase